MEKLSAARLVGDGSLCVRRDGDSDRRPLLAVLDWRVTELGCRADDQPTSRARICSRYLAAAFAQSAQIDFSSRIFLSAGTAASFKIWAGLTFVFDVGPVKKPLGQARPMSICRWRSFSGSKARIRS